MKMRMIWIVMTIEFAPRTLGRNDRYGFLDFLGRIGMAWRGAFSGEGLGTSQGVAFF